MERDESLERRRLMGPEPEEERFRRVWNRVAGEHSPVEAMEAAKGESSTRREENVETSPPREGRQEEKICNGCFSGGNGESRVLQALVLEMVIAGADYRDLARRTRRETQALLALEREKLRQGKRLAAAYFLMTGVRYWPQGTTPVAPPEGFLPGLRQRFLAEQRLSETLKALADNASDRCLRELYRDLGEETATMAAAIRRLVERNG